MTLLLLASSVAWAEPEGYRGGEGRPPGTVYNPAGGGPSLAVRAVTIEAGRSDGAWSCGGVDVAKGTEDLVTVTLVIANPAKERITATLANVDLVFEGGIEEGACLRTGESEAEVRLGARQRRLVQRRFLVPKGRTPKILVYNDDDFPALFALPKARRRTK